MPKKYFDIFDMIHVLSEIKPFRRGVHVNGVSSNTFKTALWDIYESNLNKVISSLKAMGRGQTGLVDSEEYQKFLEEQKDKDNEPKSAAQERLEAIGGEDG